MQIICKYKDFYDYKCYEFGHDPFPTFDRRDCVKLTQSTLAEWVAGMNFRIYRDRGWKYINDKEEFFYLEIGNDKYIFTATEFTRKPISLTPNNYDYNCQIALVRIINTPQKIWPAVIVLSRIEVKIPMRRYQNYEKIETCDERDIDYGNENNYFRRINAPFIVNLPILSETRLAGLLDPQKVYVGIDSYLRSLYNDKDQESEGLTDKNKAINKGFDPRESFRNIHPRK